MLNPFVVMAPIVKESKFTHNITKNIEALIVGEGKRFLSFVIGHLII
jgi:hypothetical protein